MSQPLRKLLGSQLVRNGRKVLLEELPPQTTVALYFADGSSENWSNALENFHQEMVQANHFFQVVFIPLEKPAASNKTHPALRECFFILEGEAARTKEEFLIRKYEVHHSSTVILIDCASGCVINFNGIHKILDDPKGIDFPFKHRSYTQILSSGLLITPNDKSNYSTSKTTEVSSDSHNFGLPGPTSVVGVTESTTTGSSANTTAATTNLIPYSDQNKNDFKGFFFGAYWCPPCRTFSGSLIEVYNNVRKQGKNFQVVFVSSDRSKESFERFFSPMPWPAIPYEDEKRRQELTECFNVKAIPSLIIVDDQTEKIITAEGRLEINEDLEALDFPWYPKLVEELKERHSPILNSTLSIIYFLVGEDDNEFEHAEGILQPIASQMVNSDMEEAFQPKFFIGTDIFKRSELSESLRLFFDLDENFSSIVILDMPHLRYFTLAASEVPNDHEMLSYIHKFRNSQLQYSQIIGQGPI
ncbi:unnamed protein product [Allacma fusca]|uniref:Thioredoxin domain-containing protein n=1 Tax=Allacma fusca TaxID=39272 RepID=A0A8J2P5Y4_9HEXA|nr:unnamed protein product [Allacma fusca]